MTRIKKLSSNMLKIIAAVLMLVDHIGMLLFPDIVILRIIGRLSFPIFAFLIAEGCRYTRNKLRYFLTVFSFGTAIQAGCFVFAKLPKMNILLTFSVSIAIIFALSDFKRRLYAEHTPRVKFILSGICVIALIFASYATSVFVRFDYGFLGFMTPVMASLFDRVENAPPVFDKLDVLPVRLASMGCALILLSISSHPIQFFSLLSLPIIMLYSGERGKLRMKYFFYLFYPLHLLALYGVSLLIK